MFPGAVRIEHIQSKLSKYSVNTEEQALGICVVVKKNYQVEKKI